MTNEILRINSHTSIGDEADIDHKHTILKSFMITAALFALLFAILHDLGINTLSNIQAKVDYLYSGANLLLLLWLRLSRRHYATIALTFIIISLATFTSALLFVVNDEFRIVWFYFIAYATYMLLDTIAGVAITAISVISILLSARFADLHFSNNALYTGIIGLLIASFLNYKHTRQISAYRSRLEDKNRILQMTIADRDLSLVETERANRAKSLFLANISHEIRTPMNGVLGMVQVMRGTRLDPAQQHYLETIERSGGNLLRIIDELLDISKIEAGTLAINSSPFETMRWIMDIQYLTEPLFEDNTDVAFLTDISNDLPDQLQGDATRLLQIVVNLVSNAAKFTAKGEVKLVIGGQRVSANSFYLSIRVIDTGIGIPKSQLDDIFKPFYQVTPGTTHNRGVGLGLSITKQLTDLMEGTVSVHSQEGIGSQFNVEMALPIPAAIKHEDSIEASVLEQPLRILLVDDDAINRLVIRNLFSQHGDTVIEAENGKMALDLLNKQVFDIILMDVRMPIMDGIEATKQIRSLDDYSLSQTPIIGLSASVMNEEKRNYISVGMNAVVEKPVIFSTLLQTMIEVMPNQPRAMAVPLPIRTG